MDNQKKSLFFLFVSILLLVVVFLYQFLFSAPTAFPTGAIVTIAPGTSLHALSKELQDQKVIRSRTLFDSLIILYGGEKRIAQGDFTFTKPLTVFEIARRIATSDRGLEEIKVTIPEGFTTKDMATLFAQKLPQFSPINFIKEATTFEGQLFPDTYFFFPSATEANVLQMMQDNFSNKMKPITAALVASGKDLNTIITMASIIEHEAKGDTDRGVISGILWSRLEKGIALQVDAAPETYKKKGLPLQPICSPGIPSILAALHPVSSLYLFYLHDKNGMVHYAKTFDEHKQNIQKYLK